MLNRFFILVSSVSIACVFAAMLYRWTPVPTQEISDQETITTLRSILQQESKMLAALPPRGADAVWGEALFHDRRLSRDGTLACASCHQPDKAFTDGLKTATSAPPMSIAGDRNTPTLIGVSQQHWLFWDGRADSLAAQALGPLENSIEHATNRTAVARLVATVYRSQYSSIYRTNSELDLVKNLVTRDALPEPSAIAVSAHIAGYVLSSSQQLGLQFDIMSKASPLSPASYFAKQLSQRDHPHPQEWYQAWRYLSVEQQRAINLIFFRVGLALSAFEQRIVPAQPLLEGAVPEQNSSAFAGAKLFYGKAQCDLCHTGPLLSDGQFHNTGLASSGLDLGRARGLLIALADEFGCNSEYHRSTQDLNEESCREAAFINRDHLEWVGAFKTPTLRSLRQTAPYMHDGSFATLEEVVDFYNRLPQKATVGHREESLKPLSLTEQEQTDLVNFLKAL